MRERCCLCHGDLKTSEGKSHQKRLYSCTVERDKLQECVMDTFKCSIFELNDFGEDSVLCYPCLQKLGKWAKYEKEIVHIRQQITSLLQTYMSVLSRKRLQPATGLHTPERKRSKSSQMTDNNTSEVSVSTL